MEINKQTQQAGDGSNQVQIVSATINMGISEERVRAIVEEQIQYALSKFSEEARIIGQERNKKFEKCVISRIAQIENGLQSFSDPATQILLRYAQLSAAATERKEDYDMLSELLACHVQKGQDRKNRAAISQAVQIVDKIDNDALCGLTVAHTFLFIYPRAEMCKDGLSLMSSLFDKIMYLELPSGKDWLDHLDVLRAVRIISFGYSKIGVCDHYSKTADGYICIGLRENSENHKKAVDLLESVGINGNVLVQNECLPGFVRLPIVKKSLIDEINLGSKENEIFPNKEQKGVFKQILNLYTHDASLQKVVQDNFIKMWDSFDSLHKFRLWWENNPQAFEITSVGRILAHTNAKRCNSDLPDLI